MKKLPKPLNIKFQYNKTLPQLLNFYADLAIPLKLTQTLIRKVHIENVKIVWGCKLSESHEEQICL